MIFSLFFFLCNVFRKLLHLKNKIPSVPWDFLKWKFTEVNWRLCIYVDTKLTWTTWALGLDANPLETSTKWLIPHNLLDLALTAHRSCRILFNQEIFTVIKNTTNIRKKHCPVPCAWNWASSAEQTTKQTREWSNTNMPILKGAESLWYQASQKNTDFISCIWSYMKHVCFNQSKKPQKNITN